MIDSTNQFQVGVFRALSHPTRVRMLEALRTQELSVGDLCAAVGVAPANVSQHLAVLRGAYLVATRKDGNHMFYRLRDPLLANVLETVRQYFYILMREASAIRCDAGVGLMELRNPAEQAD